MLSVWATHVITIITTASATATTDTFDYDSPIGTTAKIPQGIVAIYSP